MTAQLSDLLKSRITLVWSLLIGATLVSWRVGTDGGLDAQLATTIVVLVAFIKVRLIGLYFMELREAPLPLRVIFEGYCAAVCTVVIIMYLAGGG
jgi:heme/copper-type cytochrome/quinol oxidase subunit 4